MATSTVANTMGKLLSVVLLLGAAVTSAQSVQPTNGTLPAPLDNIQEQLRLAGPHNSKGQAFNIAPLTGRAGAGGTAVDLSTWNIEGTLVVVDPSNSNNVSNTEIAYISCDPNSSNIGPSSVVGTAGDRIPKAILLYSLTSQGCNLTGAYTYPSIYSMTSSHDSGLLLSTIQLVPTSPISALITANSTITTPGQTSSPTGTNNDGGPAPTTAVAMSILYSITGIITLLFLVIIGTGALRAHRHPERYGPRTGLAGRPRQSRAKGLARAMLETLPIVKFGDPEPVKPAQRDVELEDGNTIAHSTPEVVATENGKKAEQHTKSTSAGEGLESGMGAAQAESIKSGNEATPKEGELGCSICTEDFTAGEDVRVLPCQHKFHPACIDPWLLNVSGTCPLCRHNLNPVKSNTSETADPAAQTTESSELPPPLAAEEGEASNPQRRRVSRFVDLARLRHAPPHERIAALRQLREQSRREPTAPEDAEETSRRTRLTNRLRDTFRIRTRQNDAPPS